MLVLKEFDIKFVNILNLVNIRFFRWIYLVDMVEMDTHIW